MGGRELQIGSEIAVDDYWSVVMIGLIQIFWEIYNQQGVVII